MADKKKEDEVQNIPVNAGEMPVELVEKLDEMCAQDENSRSGFIRKLIRQEYARRQQSPLLPAVDSGEKSPVVKSEKATKRQAAVGVAA